MTRTLHIHLGMNKCGSTSIQRSFADYNDGRLAYLNVGSDNHFHLMMNRWRRSCGLAMQEFETDTSVGTPEDQNRQLDHVLSDGTSSLILSGEALSSLRFPDEAVETTLSEFRQHFDEIRAIAYIREPISYIRANMQQRLKRLPGRFDLTFHYPHYRRSLNRWADAIGHDKFQLVPFHPTAFHEEDLLVDFAARVGAKQPNRYSRSKNSSLSAEAFALIWKYYNDLAPTWSSEERLLLTKRVEYWMYDFGTTAFEIDPDQCRAVVETHSEDVFWVEKMMKAPLPEYRPIADSISFSSEAEILDYADSLEVDVPELVRSWSQRWTTIGARAARRLQRTLRK